MECDQYTNIGGNTQSRTINSSRAAREFWSGGDIWAELYMKDQTEFASRKLWQTF